MYMKHHTPDDAHYAQSVNSAVWSPDGRHILSGGDRGTVVLASAASGNIVWQLKDHHKDNGKGDPVHVRQTFSVNVFITR